VVVVTSAVIVTSAAVVVTALELPLPLPMSVLKTVVLWVKEASSVGVGSTEMAFWLAVPLLSMLAVGVTTALSELTPSPMLVTAVFSVVVVEPELAVSSTVIAEPETAALPVTVGLLLSVVMLPILLAMLGL
jgi:hypothetical protein